MPSPTSPRSNRAAVGAKGKYRYIDLVPDRHGGPPYCFFRRNGKRIPLPREFESPEWYAAYAACLAGQPVPATPEPAKQIKKGTVEAMIRAYMASSDFKKLKSPKNLISGFNTLRAAGLADLESSLISKKRIVDLINTLAAEKPGAASNLQAVINTIYKQAIAHDLVAANPVAGMTRPKSRNPDGFYSWEEAHIEQYRRHHPVGTVARLALELLLYTALRVSDACRVGPELIRDGKITLIQQKLQRFGERARVTIPVHPDLRAALDAMTVVGQKTWLYRPTGRSFRSSALSNAFGDWSKAAGLPDKCRAHGLRKACARRLIDAGVSPTDAAALTGHRDLKELMYYAEARDRILAAERAMAGLENI